MATAFDDKDADLGPDLTAFPKSPIRPSPSLPEFRRNIVLSVRGTLTNVLKYGDLNGDTRALAIIVPGNPGVPQFYDHFMKTLHLSSGGTLPVWCISHAGHVYIDNYPHRFEKDPHLTLEGQVQHKIAFFEEHVVPEFKNLAKTTSKVNNLDADVSFPKIIFIGHSIGCWIILEVMKKLLPQLESLIFKAYLLFPTIERMAISPNGRFLTPIVTYVSPWVISLPFRLFELLPRSWQIILLRFYFRSHDQLHDSILEAALSYAHPWCIANSLQMYYEEANTVVDADIDFIQSKKSKLRFYYGAFDDWVPSTCYSQMKKVFPEDEVLLCTEGYIHAFVLENSEEMGLLVAQWIEHHMSEPL